MPYGKLNVSNVRRDENIVSTQIQIDRGVQNGTEIRFLLAEEDDISALKPAGKMITDSEKKTFVYLIDEDEGYGHIHFTQAVWPLMVEVLKSEIDPVLIYGEENIRLTNFTEELDMLIFNIEGNNNYGEAFSTSVEEAFAEILKNAE